MDCGHWTARLLICAERELVRDIPPAEISRIGSRSTARSGQPAEKNSLLGRRSSDRNGDDRDVSAEPDRNDAPRTLLTLYDDALPVV